MDLTLSEFVGSHHQPKNDQPPIPARKLRMSTISIIGSGDMAAAIGGLAAHSVKHTHFSIGVSHLG